MDFYAKHIICTKVKVKSLFLLWFLQSVLELNVLHNYDVIKRLVTRDMSVKRKTWSGSYCVAKFTVFHHQLGLLVNLATVQKSLSQVKWYLSILQEYHFHSYRYAFCLRVLMCKLYQGA